LKIKFEEGRPEDIYKDTLNNFESTGEILGFETIENKVLLY
jgi:hypothetical protein